MKSNLASEEPVHYMSYKHTASRQFGLQWEEAFAIFYAVQKLDQYLHDSEFVIRTDHKPLRYIMDSPVQNKKDSTSDHKHMWLILIDFSNNRTKF